MDRLSVDRWHPFGQWCYRNGITPEKLSALVQAQGGSCCPRYAQQLWRGNRVVTLKLARIFSQITGGELSMIVIADWRPTSRSLDVPRRAVKDRGSKSKAA